MTATSSDDELAPPNSAREWPTPLSAEASQLDHGPALVVFSGGTAFNSVAGAWGGDM